jgi:hypothetical protein
MAEAASRARAMRLAATLPTAILSPRPEGPASPPEPAPVTPAGEGPQVVLVPAGPALVPEKPPVSDIVPVGCTNCGNGLLGAAPPPGPGAPCGCGGAGQCVPGRTKPCYPCFSDNPVGRFLCGVYECICCPDPCYEPRWIPLADSAFFVDAPRPVTQQRVRYEGGVNMIFPDRNEFFWARADGMGKGPKPPPGLRGVLSLRYDELSLYTEVAAGSGSLFTELPYLSIYPVGDPHAANFGDMNLGTKALLFDCELLQITFQFRTYLPTGNFTKGIGTGHVSLEPSLLVGVKLSPSTYFQGQLSEWIPIAGDPAYAGALLHYHASLNQVLYHILPDVPLIGTLEGNGWSFQDGLYTDPVFGPTKSSGETYVSAGVGLRLFVCDRIDFGVAASQALTSGHWAEEVYRAEFRWRY